MKLSIISDIHANWTALRAVLNAEPDVDQILCLGDPRAAYAVWQDGEVTLRRVAYDAGMTIGAYARVPLDARRRHRVNSGRGIANRRKSAGVRDGTCS